MVREALTPFKSKVKEQLPLREKGPARKAITGELVLQCRRGREKGRRAAGCLVEGRIWFGVGAFQLVRLCSDGVLR